MITNDNQSVDPKNSCCKRMKQKTTRQKTPSFDQRRTAGLSVARNRCKFGAFDAGMEAGMEAFEEPAFLDSVMVDDDRQVHGSHLPPLAATCSARGRKWPQVAAGACWSKWPQVAASSCFDCKWPSGLFHPTTFGKKRMQGKS